MALYRQQFQLGMGVLQPGQLELCYAIVRLLFLTNQV